MKVGYARSLKCAELLDVQVNYLQQANCTRIFQSENKNDAPEVIAKMFDFIRDGEDTIVIHELLTLNLSVKQMMQFMQRLETKGLGLEVIKQNIKINKDQWSIAYKALRLYEWLENQYKLENQLGE